MLLDGFVPKSMRKLCILPLFLAFLTIPHSCQSRNLSQSTWQRNWKTNNTDHKIPRLTLYSLDANGTFHRCRGGTTDQKTVTYSVLDNGILVPGRGPYPIDYKVNEKGDLVPEPHNTCIYKSDRTAFYLKARKDILIPVHLKFANGRVYYVYKEKHILCSQPLSSFLKRRRISSNSRLLTEDAGSKSNFSASQNVSTWNLDKTPSNAEESAVAEVPVVPDLSCNGDMTLFLLTSRGHLVRCPPDEFLPKGMKLRYHLTEHGSLIPHVGPSQPKILQLTYHTGENGNLEPSDGNSYSLQTGMGTQKSYVLGEGGILAPVTEMKTLDQSINYFVDGSLVHESRQFRQLYSNTSIVYFNEKDSNSRISDTQVRQLSNGPKFECIPRRLKRGAPTEDSTSGCSKKISNFGSGFVYDDQGKKVPLEPYLNQQGNVVIYKLTCKGHLKRMESYKEPEYDFEVVFRVSSNFILTPTRKRPSGVYMKYILRQNGNLVPVKQQKFTCKKAPGSIVYFMLNIKKQLVPVKLLILEDDFIEIHYQDYLVHTIAPNHCKGIEFLTTLYAPLYVYLNSRLTVIQSDPPALPANGATWNNEEKPHVNNQCRNLYLLGPNDSKIKIEIELNAKNVPVFYEMDWNGVFHKSPKDNKKTLSLKSYKLLVEGILLPTTETNGYIYLVEKEGNMIPYCFPTSKLRAPHGLTVKYLICKGGILLPVLVQATHDQVTFLFDSTVVYSKKAYTIEEIAEYTELVDIYSEKKDLTNSEYHTENNECVYYQRRGNVFYRYPKQTVQDYLVNHSGYLEILESGVLEPHSYPRPPNNFIKVQIEADGRMVINQDNENQSKLANDYILLKNGSLVPVEVEKSDGYIKMYKNGMKITQIKCDSTTFDDPMKLFKEPEPEKSTCKSPSQIIIPIREEPAKKRKNQVIDEKKCEQIRKTLKEMLEKDKSMAGVELEMNDSVMEEIYRMVCECSNIRKDKSEKGNSSKNCRSPRHIQALSEEYLEENESC